MKKVAIITGASRGIGAATAKLLAANGFAVCVNYLSAKEKAEALVAGRIGRERQQTTPPQTPHVPSVSHVLTSSSQGTFFPRSKYCLCDFHFFNFVGSVKDVIPPLSPTISFALVVELHFMDFFSIQPPHRRLRLLKKIALVAVF